MASPTDTTGNSSVPSASRASDGAPPDTTEPCAAEPHAPAPHATRSDAPAPHATRSDATEPHTIASDTTATPPASQPTHQRRAGRRRVSSLQVFSVVLVVALLLQRPLAEALDGTSVRIAATVFVAVCVQALPFLVLGVVLSGLIAAFVSPAALGRLLPRRAVFAVPAAGLAGAVLPGCECASVPVARRLIGQGLPDAAALTFLLAAPAINPVVLVATAVAFPGEPAMVAGRFGGSLATAVVMGWLWSRFGRPEWIAARVRQRVHPGSGGARWWVFLETARHDLVAAGGFLVLGGLSSAVLNVAVPPSWLEGLAGHLVLGIVVMALLAVLLALCSEADAFVAASLGSLPLLPRLVFLVVGPAVDVKLFALQSGTFGRGFAARFAPTTLVVATVCGTVAGLVALGGAR